LKNCSTLENAAGTKKNHLLTPKMFGSFRYDTLTVYGIAELAHVESASSSILPSLAVIPF